MPSSAEDWAFKDGSNSSDKFTSLCAVVERILRDSAHALMSDNADMVARTIVATLAHKHGMAPIKLACGRWVIDRS
jgi:hypothetical protein